MFVWSKHPPRTSENFVRNSLDDGNPTVKQHMGTIYVTDLVGLTVLKDAKGDGRRFGRLFPSYVAHVTSDNKRGNNEIDLDTGQWYKSCCITEHQ